MVGSTSAVSAASALSGPSALSVLGKPLTAAVNARPLAPARPSACLRVIAPPDERMPRASCAHVSPASAQPKRFVKKQKTCVRRFVPTGSGLEPSLGETLRLADRYDQLVARLLAAATYGGADATVFVVRGVAIAFLRAGETG